MVLICCPLSFGDRDKDCMFELCPDCLTCSTVAGALSLQLHAEEAHVTSMAGQRCVSCNECVIICT